MHAKLNLFSHRLLFVLIICLISSLFIAKNYFGLFTINTKALTDQVEKIGEIRQYFELANKAFEKNLFDLAIERYTKVLELNPTHTGALTNIGICYAKKNNFADYQKTINYFLQAVKIDPRNQNALSGLGNAQMMHGDLEQAISTFKDLDKLVPNSVMIHLAIGRAYEHLNKNDESIFYYQKAITCEPNNPHAHIALAGRYLAAGNYIDGYREYEWRVKKHPKQWDGSDLHGKTVVMLSESGLGDIIQYVRFGKELKNRGAHVILMTVPVLMNLFNGCEYIDEIIPNGSKLSIFDYFISMQSVPHIIGTTTENLIKPPYIQPNKERVSYWQQELAQDKNFKIGLCWTAGGEGGRLPQALRCIQLNEFKDLGNIEDVSVYSLQKGPARKHLQSASFTITDFGPDFDESHGTFMDTAAIMKHMDLIITVDTSIAHLAGALDVPTFTILPFCADPRWMLERSDTPWYPKMRLFRNKDVFSWQEVVARVYNAVVDMKKTFIG